MQEVFCDFRHFSFSFFVKRSKITIPGAAKPASGWYDVATAFIDVPSGTYDCQIVVESYSPLELLLGA